LGKSLRDIVINSFRVVEAGDNPEAHIVLLKDKGGQILDIENLMKAVWTTAYINDLPDSAFFYIEPGGKKDSDGKTIPRSLRHFPYKDASGKVDAIHVRNALSRIPQSTVSQEAKNMATGSAKKVLANINKELTNEYLMKGVEYVMTIEEILSKLDDEDQNFLKTEFEARTNEIGSLKKDTETKDVEIEKQKVEVEKLKKKVEDIEKAKAEEGSNKNKDEDILKDADPKIKEKFEAMQKRLDDSDKATEMQKEKIDKLQKEAEMEKIRKEATELVGISKETDKLTSLLYEVKKAVPEDKYSELKEILDSANGVIKESTLLDSIGSDEEGSGKTSKSIIKSKVEALRKIKPELTDAQATDEILQENPELYDQYNEEQAKKGV